MYLTIKFLIDIITRDRSNKAKKLLFLITITAITDAAGVATIFPFMNLVISTDPTSEVPLLAQFSQLTGVKTKENIILIVGLALVTILTLNAYLKTITLKNQIEFTQETEAYVGREYLLSALNKPYEWHLNTNSSEIGKSILSEVNLVVNSGILQTFILVSQGLIVLLIFIILAFINPIVTMMLAGFGLCTYFLLFYILKRRIHTLGELRSKANTNRFITVNEALNSFREIKINRIEELYTQRFFKSALQYAKYQSNSNMIYHLPKFILEGIIFIGITISLLILSQKNLPFDQIIPSIALFTFAGYKLLPALNQIYLASTQIKYVAKAVKDIQEKMSEKGFYSGPKQNQFDNLTVKNITFSYINNNKPSLKNISLNIKSGTWIGLVGASGSGKTTLIDVLLGLLKPTTGIVQLNGIEGQSLMNITNIAYVSQQQYFYDDTIMYNLNLQKRDIDAKDIECALQTVLLDEVVENLPSNLNFIVGENAEKLSGGQRQRLGISRALVLNPQVLVLDEATSALDTTTENKLFENLKRNYPSLTIIMITHRLQTLVEFDNIIVLEDGAIIEAGTFDELKITSNNSLRQPSQTQIKSNQRYK